MSEEKTIPESIKNKIYDLKKLETLLGHLPTQTWTVSELHKRAEDATHQMSLGQMEAQTESLFAEICQQLLEYKYSCSEIAHTINSILSQTGKIKYCNEFEVKEVLGLDERL